MLTGSADDRHLRSRMAIYAYAETPAEPRWRTSVIPWDGTQIVADVGCGNGFDLRQIVPQGRCHHAIALDLSAYRHPVRCFAAPVAAANVGTRGYRLRYVRVDGREVHGPGRADVERGHG